MTKKTNTLKLMAVFLSALLIGCGNEKRQSNSNVSDGSGIQKHDSLKREPEKKSYSLMHIELGTKIDYKDKALMDSLGVYDTKAGTKEDILYFKPKKTFRKFNEYLMKVDCKTRRVSQVFAISKPGKGVYTTEQAKGEVRYIISLLKQKYGLPENSYVDVNHGGGSSLYDDWLHTVQINDRYKFTVSRTYTTATGWTVSIKLIDTIPDMNKDDVDVL